MLVGHINMRRKTHRFATLNNPILLHLIKLACRWEAYVPEMFCALSVDKPTRSCMDIELLFCNSVLTHFK